MLRLLGWILRLALAAVVTTVVGAAVLFWALDRFAFDLPDAGRLAVYEPPTATRLYAGDGRLLAEYAREKRVFVPYDAIPPRVVQAFVAAEDQHFWHHFGLDPLGIARAALANLRRLQEGEIGRPQGASTITQQVAKNFFLTNEVSLERKLKEAVLALRLERTFSKEKILELYLNEIYLGGRAYGVAAAALAYFDKALDELTLAEAALLAGLPKAPSAYDPLRNPQAARARRDYVLGRMLEDGYIDRAAYEAARAEPLVTRQRPPESFVVADFFTEEVRRQLVARLGEAGFYEGGLAVRTTVDPNLQALADRALRAGLSAYDRKHGFRGALGRIDPAAPDALARLRAFDPGFELLDWQVALVRGAGRDGLEILLPDGSTGLVPLAELAWARRVDEAGRLGPAVREARQVAAPGDLLLVEPLPGPGRRFALRQRPLVEGALVALDPHTGRVLAMSGGFSYRQSQFNRATQARRQAGSAFKPFVYLAALEAGMTPSSIVLDAPIVIDQGPGLPKWRPENYSQQYYGPTTLRVGLEKSRNLMTVRLAQDIGMERIIELARRFGIERGLEPFLSTALGANEVTPLALTTAYAMLVNGGKRIEPYLVERIQDRWGRTVFRRDGRDCPGCSGVAWRGQLPPEPADERPQVVDPRHAFQMVNMLQGVIERGTATAARVLGRPLAGKTGTTNDAKDAWFVGFSPDLVVGVFVGFDQPASLGPRETGASVALPIWIDFMKGALDGTPPVPFRTPPGIHLVQVDAATGRRPGPDTKVVVSEAFLPGTEPPAGAPAPIAPSSDLPTAGPVLPNGGPSPGGLY
ncbi:MAG: penicillin-binding protein 1A [Geminicoccaceae bacterium]|nr:MAG: penicillin-binding protein 1A [Geminicoccaceae bacterium]